MLVINCRATNFNLKAVERTLLRRCLLSRCVFIVNKLSRKEARCLNKRKEEFESHLDIFR
jgi:hypothetical protein